MTEPPNGLHPRRTGGHLPFYDHTVQGDHRRHTTRFQSGTGLHTPQPQPETTLRIPAVYFSFLQIHQEREGISVSQEQSWHFIPWASHQDFWRFQRHRGRPLTRWRLCPTRIEYASVSSTQPTSKSQVDGQTRTFGSRGGREFLPRF